MKILFSTLFLLSFGTMAQEDFYSLYFKSDEVEGYAVVKTVDPRYFNQYELISNDKNVLRTAAGDYIRVDETGIYIEKNRLLSISREEVRENSQYIVRNNYIFGVIEGDSLPVALQEEQYLFLMPVKTYLFESINSSNKLYQLSGAGEYLVMTREKNAYYSGLYLKFTASTFQLLELSLDAGKFDLRSIKNIQKLAGDIPTYIVDPDNAEWKNVLTAFVVYDQYKIAKDN